MALKYLEMSENLKCWGGEKGRYGRLMVLPLGLSGRNAQWLPESVHGAQREVKGADRGQRVFKTRALAEAMSSQEISISERKGSKAKSQGQKQK